MGHYENFPVASALCPPRLRPAVAAIYHFARTADDIADEGDAVPEARLATLHRYRLMLEQACGGAPTKAIDAAKPDAIASAPTNDSAPAGPWPHVFDPLAEQIRAFALPPRWLHALLDAFEQDVRNPGSTPTGQALLDYCARSANPAGRLLLHLYGLDDADSLARSDAICSALQLINFWQDWSIDGPARPLLRTHRRPRAPRRQRRRPAPGARQRALARPRARALRWAEALMRSGAPLALRAPGRAGWELRLVVQGGLRVLEEDRRQRPCQHPATAAPDAGRRRCCGAPPA
ncbi:MAG: squalene/phytoene synthase family protein [Rubrivivax sp.]